MSRRRLTLFVILAAAVACAGSTALWAQSATGARAAGPCGLNLPPPQRGEILFRIPRGGRAIRRVLAGRFALCTLRRRDGSLFARLHSDEENRVLGVAFYRPSGALSSAVDASYAVADATPAEVKCGSSSQASIGPTYWKKPRKWWIGATPSGLDRKAVINAVRNAQSEWTNNINWCGIKDQGTPPATYMGETSTSARADDKSVVDWGSLAKDQNCSEALACTYTAYDGNGTPLESDIRFNSAYKWSTSGASGTLDIQTIAAHEIGHVLQFDHVTNSSKDDDTTLMWPYFSSGDTSGRKLGRGEALADNSHY